MKHATKCFVLNVSGVQNVQNELLILLAKI